MRTTSAPGKIILLGEHAVVFGQPAISLAVDLRLVCRAKEASKASLNGHDISTRTHPYIYQAIKDHWSGGPLAVTTDSQIPSGSGLGSSAAVTVALLAALQSSRGELNVEKLARDAFDIESKVQGRASPIDTSTVAHGQGVLIESSPQEGLLWHIRRDERQWFVHHCTVPEMTLVIGFTGVSAPTGPLVAKVKRYVSRDGFAREVVEEIGDITRQGLEAMRRKDLATLGHLMSHDHRLLTILGVSSPALDKLVQAALPYSYGAKLTGAGGGGSMIALTDRPQKVIDVIKEKGGRPFVVRTGVPGVRIEKEEC